jgi:hypothetical protein
VTTSFDEKAVSASLRILPVFMQDLIFMRGQQLRQEQSESAVI